MKKGFGIKRSLSRYLSDRFKGRRNDDKSKKIKDLCIFIVEAAGDPLLVLTRLLKATVKLGSFAENRRAPLKRRP